MRNPSGSMRVCEHGAANIVLADDGADARQRDIETRRLRQLRREQAELHFAGAARLGIERDRQNRGLRRMGFEIEMQQLDPELTVVGG